MALRRTTTRFSTTTTSSGMPVLDTEPLDRNRSLALRDIRARISVQEKRSSVHKMTRDRIESHGSKPGTPTAESPLVRSQSPNLTTNISGSSIHNLEGKTFVLPDVKGDVAMTTASMDGSGSSPPVTEDGSSTDRQPVANQPRGVKKLTTANSVDEQPLDQSTPLADGRSRSFTLPKSVKLSPFSGSGKELEEEQDSETDTPKFADQVTQPFRMPGQMTAVSVSALAAGEPEDAASEESGREGAVIRLTRGAPHGYSMFSPYKKPDYSYSLEEYSSSELDVFENVALWDFPIFELEKKAGDHILSHVSYSTNQMAVFQNLPLGTALDYFYSSLPPSLTPSLTPSLPHSLSPLPPSLPPSLPPTLPPPLPPSLPLSPPPDVVPTVPGGRPDGDLPHSAARVCQLLQGS